MRSQTLRALTIVAALLAIPAAAVAQFGHPLKGQWSGEWAAPGDPVRLLLDLHWDGKAISGSVQEVTGAVDGGSLEAEVKNVTIDYSKVTSWAVTMEAEGKDAAGKPVQIRLNGTLENLGAYRRLFHGTMTQGGQSAPFTLTRN